MKYATLIASVSTSTDTRNTASEVKSLVVPQRDALRLAAYLVDHGWAASRIPAGHTITIQYASWRRRNVTPAEVDDTRSPIVVPDHAWARTRLDRAEAERDAYAWARREQGYAGTLAEWCSMDSATRASYEDGAAGIGTI